MRIIDADSLLDKVLRHYTEQEKKGNLSFVACEIKQSFADMVNEAPTIEPPHWIPVTERLPEDDKKTLHFYDDGRLNFCTALVYRKGSRAVEQANRLYVRRCGNDYLDQYATDGWVWSGYKTDDVTHWMPLPSTEGLDEQT